MTVLSKNPIQHWLDTPLGSYEGYPWYGNTLHTLLYENRQDLDQKLGIIIDEIERQLGNNVAQLIRDISFIEEEGARDKFYILITLYNNGIALGSYGNTEDLEEAPDEDTEWYDYTGEDWTNAYNEQLTVK
ncbi:MAG: hypothetical protein ABXS91_08610 [Sulfurimonas sp.]